MILGPLGPLYMALLDSPVLQCGLKDASMLSATGVRQ